MQSQQAEVRNLHRFLRLCRANEWILNTPLRHLQRFISGHHRIVSRQAYYSEVMCALGRLPHASLSDYKEELISDELLRRTYCRSIEEGRIPKKYAHYEQRCSNEANLVHYYALIRELKPDVVVETGTAAGSMTSWVLAALERNKNGRLVSIDIPPRQGALTMDVTINQQDVGFLIPQEYHSRWDYRSGDAKILLPQILAEQEVDVFIHDSLHTRSHMLFEYHVARALLRPGKIILSDDILWNKSFLSFTAAHNLPSLGCIANPNLGFTVNRFDEYELQIGTGVVRV